MVTGTVSTDFVSVQLGYDVWNLQLYNFILSLGVGTDVISRMAFSSK